MGLEERCQTHPWPLRHFQDALREPHTRILVLRDPRARQAADAGIRAYCVVQTVLDEVQIHDVGVPPEHRRQGLAARLLRLALDLAARRGAVTAHLEVRPSNEAALALYRGLQFEPAGSRRNYYESPREDAILLTRRGLGDP